MMSTARREALREAAKLVVLTTGQPRIEVARLLHGLANQMTQALGRLAVIAPAVITCEARVMAVPPADHICPICDSDEIARVPRDGAVDRVVSLCVWRVYECRECHCRFYDWPSAARHYRNSVTGTLKYCSLGIKVLSFGFWRRVSRVVLRGR